MAHRKKSHKKTTHHRRRRVGGIPGSMKGAGVIILSAGGGYLMADNINEQIDKILPKTKDDTGAEVPNETYGTLGEIGGGGALIYFSKMFPASIRMFATIAGGILVGAGIKRGLKQMGVIKGYQSVPVIGRHRIPGGVRGYQSMPVLGMTPGQLQGSPAQLQGGFRVNGIDNGFIPQGSGPGMGTLMMDGASNSALCQ